MTSKYNMSVPPLLLKFNIFLGTPRHDGSNWPRLVEPAFRSNKSMICRLCTKNAKLEEIMVHRHDKELHKYCRHLPVGSQVKIFLQDKHKSDHQLESNQEHPRQDWLKAVARWFFCVFLHSIQDCRGAWKQSLVYALWTRISRVRHWHQPDLSRDRCWCKRNVGIACCNGAELGHQSW